MSISVETAAKVAYEVNRVYCDSIGDTRQLPWDEADDWQRESCISGMKAHMHDPYMTAEDSHVKWMKCRKDDGWKYGPRKDTERKEHPCLVPYEDLAPSQRAKDSLFKAVANALRGDVEMDPEDIATPLSCATLARTADEDPSHEVLFVQQRVRAGLEESLKREKVPRDLSTVGERRRKEIVRFVAEEVERIGKAARAEWDERDKRRRSSNLFD
jgi:hypothetical protein